MTIPKKGNSATSSAACSTEITLETGKDGDERMHC